MTPPQPVENRAAFVQDLVLASMADDYENFRTVLAEVTHWGSLRGLQLTRNEVRAALKSVLEAGLAQAYVLSSRPPHSTPVSFSEEKLRELYFFLTPAGKDAVKNVVELDVVE